MSSLEYCEPVEAIGYPPCMHLLSVMIRARVGVVDLLPQAISRVSARQIAIFICKP